MRTGVLVLWAVLLGGCTAVRGVVDSAADGLRAGPPTVGASAAPEHPEQAPPGERGDPSAWQAALAAEGDRIVISRDALRLWLVRGDSALFSAPVAVGRDTVFRYGQNEWDFNTPTGRMRVLGKEETPIWVPPDWHYLEKAVERDLEPVRLRNGQRVLLSDSTIIEVRQGAVGRINRYGHWHEFTPGGEIIFDDRIFIPPIGSPQRRIPDVLGTHRLILRDGYLIHGTPEEDSIGQWASHGCVRMLNRDVERLYEMVGVGTPVYVY